MDAHIRVTTKEEKLKLGCKCHKKICACWNASCRHMGKRPMMRCTKVESRLLARLYKLLRRLPPTERRTVLEARLVEAQRLALESWMLSNRWRSRSSLGNIDGKIGTCSDGDLKLVSFSPNGQHANTPMLSLATRSPHSLETTHRKIVANRLKVVAGSELGGNGYSRVEAVDTNVGVMCNKQKSGCYYSAQLSIGSLRLMSKADRDLNTVLLYRDVLQAIRQRLLPIPALTKAGYFNSACFEKRFREAVSETLQERQLDATSMGLKFKVCIRPLWISRPLCTPAYSIANNLDKGLHAFHRLHDARRGIRHRSYVLRAKTLNELTEEWSGLREAYMEIMLDAGRHRSKVQATLDQLQTEFLRRQDRKVQDMNRILMATGVRQSILHRQPRKCGIVDRGATNHTSRFESKLECLLRQWACLERQVPRDVLRKKCLIARRPCKWCRCEDSIHDMLRTKLARR